MTHLLLIALTAATLSAANATGTWTGTVTPDGREAGPAHLVLTQDGNTLTGTAGESPADQYAIQNGKAENGKLTFELTAGNGTMKVTLEQQGDEMAGEVQRERDGNTLTAKLAVKRVK